MDQKPPKHYLWFQETFPDVAEAYESLGSAVHGAGPLPEQTRALIKVAVSTGRGLQGAVHSHVRKALRAGCSEDEIRHAVMLAMPTIGLPATMAALSWVRDVVEKD